MNKNKIINIILLSFISTSILASCQNENNDDKDDDNTTINEEEYLNNFQPVLRFALGSDVHITEADRVEDQHFKRYFEETYSYVNKETKYTKLDAFVMAGDLADHGWLNELNKVKTMADTYVEEGTEFVAMCGNHEFVEQRDYHETAATCANRFADVFGAYNFHKIINGYHFIVVSPSNYEGYEYEQTTYLKNELKAAVEADSTKPIFVITHFPAQFTCYGSSWGDTDINRVIKDYPQVVNCAGHSHYPISDPRSIYQKDYTVINTGSLSYYSMEINGINSNNIYSLPAEDGRYLNNKCNKDNHCGEYYIVEVDASGAIKLVGYDVTKPVGRKMFTKLIYSTLDKTKFKTEEMKLANDKAPEWDLDDNPEITVKSNNTNSITINFPVAESECYIESYRGYLYDENNNLINTYYSLGEDYLVSKKKNLVMELTGLQSKKDYTLKLHAISAYNKESTSFLTGEVSTK